MWGINHLAPNKSTYSLSPQPAGAVLLLLRVAHTHLLARGGRCSAHTEVTGENVVLGDVNWVRDSAKPEGGSRRGLYPWAGAGGGCGSSFAGENRRFKPQSLSLWFIKRKSPVYPRDGRGAWGATSICAPPLRGGGRARRGKIRPELCAEA